MKLTLVIYSASIIEMTNGQEQLSKIRLLLAWKVDSINLWCELLIIALMLASWSH
ncbi:MAG: hypothetical protein QGI86_02315 [Candidatus Poribacteria bacterium]|nr:hypothetical protein [Candidatus Poribacteria bacterium]MDP6747284.1 hypothetical protein [Candidatus Poribacteria bacterium]MDP6997797.1 hypothetical protein [Candidatus Poribacteria bacterium]